MLSRLIIEMAQTEAVIASGYFEPNVWKLIGPALQQLRRFRLLLGRQPEIALPQNDLVDLRRYYQQKLQGDYDYATKACFRNLRMKKRRCSAAMTCACH